MDPHALRRSARLGLFPFPRLTESVFPRMAPPNSGPRKPQEMLGLCVTSALLVAGLAMRHARVAPEPFEPFPGVLRQAAEVEPSCLPQRARRIPRRTGPHKYPVKLEILGHAPLGTPWGFQAMWSFVGVGMIGCKCEMCGGKWLDWTGRAWGDFLVEFLLPGWATKALTRSPDYTRRDLENCAVTI